MASNGFYLEVNSPIVATTLIASLYKSVIPERLFRNPGETGTGPPIKTFGGDSLGTLSSIMFLQAVSKKFIAECDADTRFIFCQSRATAFPILRFLSRTAPRSFQLLRSSA